LLTRGKLLSLCVYTLVVINVVLLVISSVGLKLVFDFTYPAVFKRRDHV
jgi:hypothetical protein